MAANWKKGGLFAAGLLVGAIAAGWAALSLRGGDDAPARPVAARPVDLPALQTVALGAGAVECAALDPILPRSGSGDGAAALPRQLAAADAKQVAELLVSGKEAAASGHPRDAEVHFLTACRRAELASGGDGVPLADAMYQLGRHYAQAARGGAGVKAGEATERARRLYAAALQAYRGRYGDAHEKTRFAAEGLARVGGAATATAQAEPARKPAPARTSPPPETAARATAPTPAASATVAAAPGKPGAVPATPPASSAAADAAPQTPPATATRTPPAAMARAPAAAEPERHAAASRPAQSRDASPPPTTASRTAPAPVERSAAAAPAAATSPSSAAAAAAAQAAAANRARDDARDRSRRSEPVVVASEAPPAAPTRIARPSFDCARARSTPEKMICADDELARMDRELGRLHARAKAAAPDAREFQRRSDAAWRERESTCRDRDCLRDWYAQRRQALQSPPVEIVEDAPAQATGSAGAGAELAQ